MSKKRLILGIGPLIFLCILLSFYYFIVNPKGRSREKVLLVCMDGATWTIMNPLIKNKELPVFSRLVRNGVSGALFSDSAFSPPAWTSIATGKREERHGVKDFGDVYKINSRHIWSILSDRDIKVGVLLWLMSLPEKVDGFMYIHPWYMGIDEKLLFPADIEREVRSEVDILEEPPCGNTEVYKQCTAAVENFRNISSYLIKRCRPSFVAMGFYRSDLYQHRYWSAMEPEYFDITGEEVLEKKDLITGCYKDMDDVLDYFISREYTIIFVSDHGFCRSDIRSGPRLIRYFNIDSNMQHVNFLINRFLEEAGFLNFVPKLEQGGQIDFSKSTAFFYNNVALGVRGIRINRRIVQEDEIARLRREITSLLREARFETGEDVFVGVRENILRDYESVPDIVFDLNPIFERENIRVKTNENSPLNITFEYLLDEEGRRITRIRAGGNEYDLGDFIDYSRDGVHEPEGVIIMSGKGIKKNKVIKYAKLTDVTPTILYLFGLPIAKDMDGRVLIEAFEPDFVSMHPVTYIDSYETSDKRDLLKEIHGDKEKLKEKLHSLGYLH